MNLIEILTQLRKGKCVIEAQEKLQDLVKHCRDTGKRGELTLKLKVTPGSGGEMMITGTAESKIPKADVVATLFYDDEDGALLREDPRQDSLPFDATQSTAANAAAN